MEQMQFYEDESFVLPALLRFGGEPIVDEATGNLLYKFPSLQLTARKQVGCMSYPMNMICCKMDNCSQHPAHSTHKY